VRVRMPALSAGSTAIAPLGGESRVAEDDMA
jgi:hypothetical protein